MTQTEDRALLIKKLLNKAEGASTPEERDAFSAKAAELMLKWEIDDALISDADRVKTELIIQRYVETNAPKSYSHEVCSIGTRIAPAFNCKAAYSSAGSAKRVLIVGFESDVDRFTEMYRSLALQCSSELKREYDRWLHSSFWTPSGTDKFKWKKSFIKGYADRVGERLQALRKTVVAQSEPGTDLVLVDRSKQVQRHVDGLGWGMSRPRSYTVGGYGAGDQAGQRANIGGTGIGGGRGQLGR